MNSTTDTQGHDCPPAARNPRASDADLPPAKRACLDSADAAADAAADAVGGPHNETCASISMGAGSVLNGLVLPPPAMIYPVESSGFDRTQEPYLNKEEDLQQLRCALATAFEVRVAAVAAAAAGPGSGGDDTTLAAQKADGDLQTLFTAMWVLGVQLWQFSHGGMQQLMCAAATKVFTKMADAMLWGLHKQRAPLAQLALLAAETSGEDFFLQWRRISAGIYHAALHPDQATLRRLEVPGPYIEMLQVKAMQAEAMQAEAAMRAEYETGLPSVPISGWEGAPAVLSPEECTRLLIGTLGIGCQGDLSWEQVSAMTLVQLSERAWKREAMGMHETFSGSACAPFVTQLERRAFSALADRMPSGLLAAWRGVIEGDQTPLARPTLAQQSLARMETDCDC